MTPKKWIESTKAIGIVSKSICLSNLENINAMLINEDIPQSDH